MEILSKLGIDPSVMIAQAVNFFALLAILTYFVYKPILRILDERRERIATAEQNAERIEHELAATEERTRAELAKAQSEAREIVANAKKIAKDAEEKMVAEAKAKVEKVVEEGRAQIKKDRDDAAAAIQHEVAQIVILATEKLLGREVDGKDHDRLVADATKELKHLKK